MKRSSSSSFRNKITNAVNIPGTKVSVNNAQLLTSTGSSTLDFLIGGGLAVGTVCLIEEDRYNSYASLLMKYFLAEGTVRKHSLFLAGGDKDPKDFLKELPASKSVELGISTKPCSEAELPVAKNVKYGSNTESTSGKYIDIVDLALLIKGVDISKLDTPCDSDTEPEKGDSAKMASICSTHASGDSADESDASISNTKSEAMKIAWRYNNSQCVEDAIKAESHNMSFDLTKTMPYEEIEKCSVFTWIPADSGPDMPNVDFLKMPYLDLLNKIKSELESQKLRTSKKNAETILRIGINSIGSPLWQIGNTDSDIPHIVRFVYALKSCLRTSFAVAVITVPFFLISNDVLMSRIRHMADTVIALESFVGSDKMTNPAFKDYDGLLHIRKMPVLNTFTYPRMTDDLAFKLKKRGLIIECLHIPPELRDPTPEQQEQFGCSGLGKKMDF